MFGAAVLRDSQTERMREMKTFEKNLNTGNVDLRGLVIEEIPNSLLVTAKKELYVPEKKIILLDEITEREAKLLMGATNHMGGLIV